MMEVPTQQTELPVDVKQSPEKDVMSSDVNELENKPVAPSETGGNADWYSANNNYLGKALAWLRLKLEMMALQAGKSGEPVLIEPEPDQTAVKRGWPFGRQPTEESPPLALPQVSEKSVMLAKEAMETAARMDPPPALLILSYRFGLSPFERDILLLCAALEFDSRIARLCARAQDSPSHPFPTFALAMALFDEPSWDALSSGRPLRFWRLIEINQPGATPLTASALRADERIVGYLKGVNQLDDRLAPMLVPFDDQGNLPLPPSQESAAQMITAGLSRWQPSDRAPLYQLIGKDGLSKQAVVRRALSSLGWQSYRLPAGLLPTDPAELESFTRLWRRESTLLPLAIYLDLPEEAEMTSLPARENALYHFLSRCGSVAFVDVVQSQASLGTGVVSLEIAKPTPGEQADAWQDVLGEQAGDLPVQLSAEFNLNLASIRAITHRARSTNAEDEAPESFRARLWAECLQRARPQLDRMAQHIEAKATWDDLVLAPEPLAQLHEIAAQVRQRSRVYEEWGFRRIMNRGFGISALFSGESGTGKTMAAEVIANELNLYLYRIDLSAVVSKYIGETEKNLRQAFDAAEDGGVILFFDEADALFGKRSEVKDSHDRYANIEINYLLQRMEAFGGLAILATNMKSALDPAFWRRLRFIVNFPFPGVAERKLIWEKVLPTETPREDLNFTALAKLNLTGGSIHNVGLNASFRAAQAGLPVTMDILNEAARSEYRKLERPINEADFRTLKAQEIKP